MKKILSVVFAAFVAFGLVGCADNESDNSATSISISGDSTVAVGDDITLVAHVQPASCNDVVTWRLSNSKASIIGSNRTAIITGEADGTVSVIASVGNVSATKKITVGNGSSTGGSDSSSGTGSYSSFKNFPLGKQTNEGTLTVTNNLTREEVLVFDGTVAGENYVGTIPAGSEIKVRLDAAKFHTLVGILKSEYDEKKDLTLCGQSSVLTYYSNTQAYKVSVSPSSLSGAGKWIFNNNTNYWASIESVTNDGTVFAVISPNAKRVIIPVELNKSYDYKIVYKKELKYENTIVAITDSSVITENDTVQLRSDSTTQFTTDLNGTKESLAADLKPSVLFINNSGKSVRIYNGQIQLSNINNSTAEDFVVIDGSTSMVTGITAGTDLTSLVARSNAWNAPQNCTVSKSMEKGKVYRVTITKNSNELAASPIIWTVVEEPASNYYTE